MKTRSKKSSSSNNPKLKHSKTHLINSPETLHDDPSHHSTYTSTPEIKQNKLEKLRSHLLDKTEIALKEVNKKFFDFQVEGEISENRANYCWEIYRYLVLGYFEIVKESGIRKVLHEDSLSTTRINNFLQHFSTQEQALQFLQYKTQQIQQKLFQHYNSPLSSTPTSTPQKCSKKYNIQLHHLIRNLEDPENPLFREYIVTSVYTPIDLACMTEIDMLEPRKKQYIYSGGTNDELLDYTKVHEKKNQRLILYERQLAWIKCNRRSENFQKENKEVQGHKLEYFLSKLFVDKLEVELMSIPMKKSRKVALANLKKVLG